MHLKERECSAFGIPIFCEDVDLRIRYTDSTSSHLKIRMTVLTFGLIFP